MEVSKCWKIVEFPKNSVKMKKCKAFYKAQTARQILHRYTELCRHFLSKCFENTVLGRLEMVQCFSWHQPGVYWKIRKGFWLSCASIFFQCWVSWGS